MSSGSTDDEAITLIKQQWAEFVPRFGELHQLFENTQLGITAEHAMAHLRLADSLAIKKWLEARRLPPFKLLRNWYYLVAMLERAEAGDAIAAWALRQGKNPSVYYRFVLSLGGGTWEQWLARGSPDAKRRVLLLWSAYSSES